MKSWEKTRIKGKKRFCLLIGLSWGIVTSFVIKLFDLLEYSFSEIYFNNKFLVSTLIFLIIGIFIMGPVFWFLNEQKYKSLIKEKAHESNS